MKNNAKPKPKYNLLPTKKKLRSLKAKWILQSPPTDPEKTDPNQNGEA
ncbi:hypothetical protein HYE01_00690 [Mycoplasmopsis bovis]|nr:hypothetical protein HYE01_00690 [Mycoplasmopsis bovis]